MRVLGSRTGSGLILGLVIATAVVMAIAAYTELFIALATARQPRPMGTMQVRARFASEAGLAWAVERLYENVGDIQGRLARAGPGATLTLQPPPPTKLTNGLPVTINITYKPETDAVTGLELSGYHIEAMAAF